jgi:hypothetical protein
VQSNHGRMVISAVLGPAVAAGFQFQMGWLVLGSLVLFFGWLGYPLGPER